MHFRIFILLFMLAAATFPASAQSIGVPVCDEFLTKFETCVATKAPAAQQSALKEFSASLRKAWREILSGPNTPPTAREQVETICKGYAEQMQDTMKAYGCSL